VSFILVGLLFFVNTKGGEETKNKVGVNTTSAEKQKINTEDEKNINLKI